MTDTKYLRIAIASPLRRTFDYLPPQNCDFENLKPGVRVRVPFGRRETIGILLAVTPKTDIEFKKLKKAIAILDATPPFSSTVFSLCLFASEYYHHPIGEVLLNALPKLLRQGKEITKRKERPIINKSEAHKTAHHKKIELNSAQKNAIDTVLADANKNSIYLLDGVTGSGKTEVYLRIIENVTKDGKQALILVPEISLTPQTVRRFTERFPDLEIIVLHSRLTDRERLIAWQKAQRGFAKIIIGTRSALFTPLTHPGIIVLDEEHDLSFKQQSSLRYSARDLAVLRSKLENIPLIMGSATPSFSTLYNVTKNRYISLPLPERASGALHPELHLVDIRKIKLKSGLSLSVIEKMREHLEKNGQILIFVNRRGFAPTLLCHDCGWIAMCEKCDVRLVLHQTPASLNCHHCGAVGKAPCICPQCKSENIIPCGIGTERLEMGLKKIFPEVSLCRIDSDTTQKTGSMQKIITSVKSGEYRILIGTQMLTKGHHFPDVTMVVILNADFGLFSADFRAFEYLAQLIIQVGGRAGRAEKPGEVYIQTHHPDHSLLLELILRGYKGFVNVNMKERKNANLPPYSYLAMLRAEGKTRAITNEFLTKIVQYGNKIDANKKVTLLGPAFAAIERKSNRYRAQILLKSISRKELHTLLAALVAYIENMPKTGGLKWSLDVDPIEILG